MNLDSLVTNVVHGNINGLTSAVIVVLLLCGTAIILYYIKRYFDHIK